MNEYKIIDLSLIYPTHENYYLVKTSSFVFSFIIHRHQFHHMFFTDTERSI